MSNHEPVYLIDGSAYIYRAYHAIAPLSNSSGLPTHAIFGFTNILLRVIREKTPQFLAVAFDLKGPTFRHELFSEYKANRPPMPEDLSCQIPYIKQVVEAHNIVCLEKKGVEADDLIASAARRLQENGSHVIVVSGDKDLLQLASSAITIWDPMNDKFMDPAGVEKKYHVRTDQILDYFSLVGDSSDNIPGVPGIGPKTAEKLINDFGSLDDLYANLDQVEKPKLLEKLTTHKKEAFLSRDLIRLKEDLTIPSKAEEYRLPSPNASNLRELYTFLGFTRLIKSELQTPAIDHRGYKLIQTSNALQNLLGRVKKAPLLVLDTETNSLDPLTADLVGLSLCFDDKEAFYIPMGHKDEEGASTDGQLDKNVVLKELRPLLENKKITKLGHNLKFDIAVLETHDIQLSGPLWDTMIASYLVDPSRRTHKLDDLCEELLEKRLTSFAEVTKGDKRPDSFVYVPLEKAKDYSCEDVIGSYLLWEHFQPQLESFDLWELFSDIEMRLVPILARMERTGIVVDAAILNKISKDFGEQLVELEGKIFSLAGETFNINSPRQLSEILFEKLNLPHGRKTKTGYSTDVKVLEKLAAFHELPATIMAHRNLSKLKSTYVDKLTSLIHPKTGRIHTSFNQTVTATGRLSSSNPNLQNIPIRTPEGQRIREVFIAPSDHIFLSADYSQIDLRVLAHYSQDPALLKAFKSEQDIHNQTAAEIFRVSPMFITPQMRRVAKTINFGIVYGMSAFGLASQLNLSRKEAATFIGRYFDLYSGVKQFMETIVKQARENGFVTTLLNRRRPLPDIKSTNKTRREFAERTAINTPIQGTAADIIKLATINADQQLTKKGLKAKLLLQIHDELVFEVPKSEIDKTAAVVKEAMESVLSLDVPLVVNIATGKNLAET